MVCHLHKRLEVPVLQRQQLQQGPQPVATGAHMSTGQRPAPPAPQATAAVTAMPLKVSVHLAPYNGVSSVVQWWMNFITYIELFQMTNDQTLNILPFYFTEPVKHWFYQLQLTTRASLTNFKQAFFARYRKNGRRP